MATKAGTLHEGIGGLSLPIRLVHSIRAMRHRRPTEPDSTVGLVASAELGRETGARC